MMHRPIFEHAAGKRERRLKSASSGALDSRPQAGSDPGSGSRVEAGP